MKRYQCIKNVWAEPELIYPEGGRLLIFKAGKVYREHFLDNYPEMTDEFGNIHLVTDQLLNNFQELLDLNVDDDDQVKYVAVQPSHGCTRTAIAICVAFAVMTAITIYLALTWRS